MSRSLFGRGDGYRDRRRGPRSRARSWLLWILLLIVILIVLSVLFGGFQKGTKAGGLSNPGTSVSALSLPAGRDVP